MFDDNSVGSFLFKLVCVVVDVSLRCLMRVLYVSGVTQFILITLFDKIFVEYCSSSAMFLIWLIIAS